jgi:hypothetical protein
VLTGAAGGLTLAAVAVRASPASTRASPASVPAATPVWPAASALTLPHGASTAPGAQRASLTSVACPGPGSCVTVGTYTDGEAGNQPLAATESEGTWAPASKLTLPPGAATIGATQYAELKSVWCAGPGECVAGGLYLEEDGSYQEMVVNETHGVWAPASRVQLPANASTAPGEQAATLLSLTCTGPGQCVAVGDYVTVTENYEAMVATEQQGVWARARELQLPADASTERGRQRGRMWSVACTSPGACVATGQYTDDTGAEQAAVYTEAGGTWSAGRRAQLPIDATTKTHRQNASLYGVSCTGPGACVVVGAYVDATGNSEAMAATERGGVWQRPRALPLPPGAATHHQEASLSSVACTAPGSCVAAGTYADTHGRRDYQAMLATDTGGAWARATRLALPADANTVAGRQKASLNALTCTAPGECVTVGYFTDANGRNDYQALVASSHPAGVGESPAPPPGVSAVSTASTASAPPAPPAAP